MQRGNLSRGKLTVGRRGRMRMSRGVGSWTMRSLELRSRKEAGG